MNLPLLRRFSLLLLTLLLAQPAAAQAQSPSFSDIVFTPASGATLRVGDQVRVAVTVSNSPSGVRLFFGPQGGFASSLAANFTSVGGDRYEAAYSVSSGALSIAQNGATPLYFQIQATKGTSTVISTTTSTYTIAPAGPPPTGQPDVTVALPAGQALSVTTAGSDVRVAAGVIISNRGTAPAGVFNGAVVLSPSQTYSVSSLLRNPANGGILRGNFAFAEFARSAGQPVVELPANGSFDPFNSALTLPATAYAALLAQSPVPLYAFAVVDFDNGLAESNENNNAVLLGQLTAPTPGGNGLPATTLAVAPPTPPVSGGPNWAFTATQPSTATGLFVRVQSTLTPTTESSWTDLPGGGRLTRSVTNPAQWTLSTNNIPLGVRFFRAISAASGVADSISAPVGPFTVTTGTGNTADFTARLKANVPNKGGVVVPEQPVSVKVKTEGLPEGVTVASVAYAVNGQSVNSSSTKPVTFQRTFPADQAGEKVLVATVTDSRGLKVTTPELRFRVAPVGAGGLALETVVEPASGRVAPGGVLTYRYVLTNTNSTAAITGVQVVAKVPKGTEPSLAGPDAEFTPNGKTATIRLGDLAAGQSATATLIVRALGDLREGEMLLDEKVKVSASDAGVSVNGTVAATRVTVSGPPADDVPALALVKSFVDRQDDPEDSTDTTDDPRPIASNVGQLNVADPGERVTIALAAFNGGKGEARGVTLRDITPEGCAFVEGSARLGDTPLPAESITRTVTSSGRTSLVFSLGDLPRVSGRLVSYQIRVLLASEAGAASRGVVVKSSGGRIAARNLSNAPDSFPRELPLLVAPKATPAVTQTAVPARAVVGQPITYTVKLRNSGAKKLKGARLVNPIPAATEFVEASVGNPGAGQTIEVAADQRSVIFNFGNVNAGQEVSAILRVRVLPALTQLNPAQVVNRPFYADSSTVGRAQADAYLADLRRREAGGDHASGPRTRLDFGEPLGPDLLAFAQPDYSLFLDPALTQTVLTKPYLVKIAPQSVRAGETFDLTFVGGNLLPIPGGTTTLAFDLPAGTEFVSSSVSRSELDPGNPRRFVAYFNRLPGSGEFVGTDTTRPDLLNVRVTLRAVGAVGERLREANAQLRVEPFASFFPRPPTVFAKSSVTLVIAGDAATADNQQAIGRAQIENQGLPALDALNDPRTLERFRAINRDSASVLVSGADHVQVANGVTLIPIPMAGGPRLVAAGGGNLIGNDGSTLVAAGGGNVVAAGLASNLRINGLIGNDGSTLVGNDGSTIYRRLIGNDGSTLISRRNFNLVAAGGGNLVGNDGASLIGLDGSTLRGVTIASLVGNDGASLVAAGGGNLISDNGLGIVANRGLALVAADGGNLVAAGGGNLIGLNGASVVSRDPTAAVTLANNGAFLVGGGGSPAAPLVAAGGGN